MWVTWNGPQVKKNFDAAARAALFTVGKEIMAAAKLQVPLLEGDLRDSGKVRKARRVKPSVIIAFGGPNAMHAIRWHENKAGVGVGSKAASFKRGRKSRYLADPFNLLARRRVQIEYRAEIRRRRAG